MQTSCDAITALSDTVRAILDDAVSKAKVNSRSRLKMQDL
jgi:hypothetical protein